MVLRRGAQGRPQDEQAHLKAKALSADGRRSWRSVPQHSHQGPVSQEAHLMRGSIFESLEMLDKASDSYEKAVGPSELRPGN